MLIISVRDNENNRWKTNAKNNNNKQGQERTRKSLVKGWELNDFIAFELGFHQLMCKGSLIFKSNLELALSIILKERELFESKHVAV